MKSDNSTFSCVAVKKWRLIKESVAIPRLIGNSMKEFEGLGALGAPKGAYVAASTCSLMLLWEPRPTE